MQRTTITNFNRRSKIDVFISFIVKNNSLLIIFLFLILGIIFGSISEKIGISFNEDEFLSFLSARQNKTFINIFLNSFLNILPFIAFSFFSGTCIQGFLITPCIMFYKGFTLGSMLGFLYLNHAIYGIAFNCLIVVPSALVSSFALMLSLRESFLFSLSISKIVFPGKVLVKNMYQDFILFFKKQLIIVLLFIFSCFLDALFSVSFIKYFNF